MHLATWAVGGMASVTSRKLIKLNYISFPNLISLLRHDLTLQKFVRNLFGRKHESLFAVPRSLLARFPWSYIFIEKCQNDDSSLTFSFLIILKCISYYLISSTNIVLISNVM